MLLSRYWVFQLQIVWDLPPELLVTYTVSIIHVMPHAMHHNTTHHHDLWALLTDWGWGELLLPYIYFTRWYHVQKGRKRQAKMYWMWENKAAQSQVRKRITLKLTMNTRRAIPAVYCWRMNAQGTIARRRRQRVCWPFRKYYRFMVSPMSRSPHVSSLFRS